MIVVSSDVTTTFLAVPRSESFTTPANAEVLENGVGGRQRGDVAQHGLAAVAVAGGLHRDHVENAAELVDHQRGQRLAFDVLGDNQQRLARLAHGFQQRDQVLRTGDFVFMDQHAGSFPVRRSASPDS